MRMSLLGGASRTAYAHLAGLVPTRTRASDDDKDPKDSKKSRRAEGDDDDQDDEPKGRKSKAEDTPEQYPDDDESAPKGKKSRRAEDDDDDQDDEPKGKKSRVAEDEDDQDDEPPKDGKKSKRARAEDEDDDAEDDDDKEEMSGKSAAASARRRERARCKAIFSHPAAATNVALAASLAFDTTQTRKEALAVLKSQAGNAPAHAVRGVRRNPDLGAGGESDQRGQQAVDASWDRAMKKAGITPKART